MMKMLLEGLFSKSIQRDVDSPQSTAYIIITVICCRVRRLNTTIRGELSYFGTRPFKHRYGYKLYIDKPPGKIIVYLSSSIFELREKSSPDRRAI